MCYVQVVMWDQKGSDSLNQLWTWEPLTGRIRSLLNDDLVLELDS